jgi:hypothetical protein
VTGETLLCRKSGITLSGDRRRQIEEERGSSAYPGCKIDLAVMFFDDELGDM